eukprot:5578901-Prymnesium_polylepis.1
MFSPPAGKPPAAPAAGCNRAGFRRFHRGATGKTEIGRLPLENPICLGSKKITDADIRTPDTGGHGGSGTASCASGEVREKGVPQLRIFNQKCLIIKCKEVMSV